MASKSKTREITIIESKGAFSIFKKSKLSKKDYDFSLFEKESRQGAIPFDPTDQLLLDAFARQVHVSLENHDLHQQSLEKETVLFM